MDFEWPWEYSYPPFFTIQPHSKTREIQLSVWGKMLKNFIKQQKQSILNVNSDSPVFSNRTISRSLSIEGRLLVLEELQKSGFSNPVDKTKTQWEIYWCTLDELGIKIYDWAVENAMIDTVCTVFEINEHFSEFDENIILKALATLVVKGKCEIIPTGDSDGVKFF